MANIKVNDVATEKKSFLYSKKRLISILKWVGYFPVRTNHGLTTFQMKVCSCPFFTHMIKGFFLLFFYTSYRLLVIDPTTEIPLSNHKPQTNTTSNISTEYKFSSKYNFSAVVDYCQLSLVLLYILIVTVLAKSFATFLSKLCNAVDELDEVINEPMLQKHISFGKLLYAGLFFKLLWIFAILCFEIASAVLMREWWMETFFGRLDSITSFITFLWIYTTHTVFELIFTISVETIINRIISAYATVGSVGVNLPAIIRKMIDVLEHFQTTFGGLLGLHLSFYTLELMMDTFQLIIYGSQKGDLLLLSTLISSILGSVFKIYNIVSCCDALTRQIVQYLENLNDFDSQINKKDPGRRVSVYF